MSELALLSDDLVLLARVAGLRGHHGGRYQRRWKEVASVDPSQRFAGERARYAMTEDGFRTWCQNHYKDLSDGEIGLGEFYRAFSKELYRFQVSMYLLGRRAVGRTDSKLSEEEKRELHGLHSREMKYFSGFVLDYVRGTGRMPLPQRLDLYALGGYRIYLRGALRALPFGDRMRFPWRVTPAAETCEDCVWKEEESERRGGFTIAELDGEIGWPGETSEHARKEGCESCGRRCRCHLELPGGIKQLPRTRPTAFKAVKRRQGGKAAKRIDMDDKKEGVKGIAKARRN